MLHDFQLQADPFGVAADPKFLYFTKEHLEVIASLFHTVVEASGLAAVIAPPGMGKTTLLHYFQQRMARWADTVLLDSSFEDRKDMLLSILAAFGVPYSGSYSENGLRLRSVLLERHSQGRRVVLMFDEAQDLSAELLESVRLLSNLETPQAKLLQIILSGQRLLDKKLELPELEQLLQRINAFCRLHPLNACDVEAYINHRLKVAGRIERLFTPQAVEAIARCSNCIPRNINTLCSGALVQAWTSGRRLIDQDIIENTVADLRRSDTRDPDFASVASRSGANCALAEV